MTELIGRNKEKFELVHGLCSYHKLIQLVGIPGIGKTSLTKSALKFIADRRNFIAGIIYLNAK